MGCSLHGVQEMSEDEFEDGYGSDLMGDEEDRAKLMAMNELQREMILADRAEERDKERERLRNARLAKQAQQASQKAREASEPGQHPHMCAGERAPCSCMAQAGRAHASCEGKRGEDLHAGDRQGADQDVQIFRKKSGDMCRHMPTLACRPGVLRREREGMQGNRGNHGKVARACAGHALQYNQACRPGSARRRRKTLLKLGAGAGVPAADVHARQADRKHRQEERHGRARRRQGRPRSALRRPEEVRL